MKRVGHLFEKLISDENLYQAINEVNKTHHYIGRGNARRVNKISIWVEVTKDERVKELREIILNGFVQQPMREFRLYDVNAQKWRDICEPFQYPDQYIHHAVQQCLEPVIMKGMDYYCCGSIRKRGAIRGIKAIKKWMKNDKAGTRCAIECDIHQYYKSIEPSVAFDWFKRKIKDRRMLDVIWAIIKDKIIIGGYFSQWIANAILQEIDQNIHKSGLCTHYVRYIDNFTIFGSRKRRLNTLIKYLLPNWLQKLGLTLKPNKQLFEVDKRMVSALGYRYNHEKTYLRKRNLLSIKRKVRKIQSKILLQKPICRAEAACILSKLGQLCHCNSYYFRRNLYEKGFVTTMKNIIRISTKRKVQHKTWKYILSQAQKMENLYCA